VPRHRQKLEDLLVASRREPPPELVHSLARYVSGDPARPLRLRGLIRVAVLTVALLVALFALGGLGYAMTAATDLVNKVVSHATYASRPELQLAGVNAALDQYGTTTTVATTTEAATTTVAATTTTATTTVATTTVATTTTTGAGGEVTVAAKTGTSGAIAVQAPGSSQQVIVSWTGTSFAMPVSVQVDPTPKLGSNVVGVGGQFVAITLTAADGQAVHELSAPLELVFKSPHAGYVPAVSEDGITFRELVPISGPPLPDSMDDGYYVDSAGNVHILTRHVTIFAVVSPAVIRISASGKRTPPAGSGKFGDPTLNHPGPPGLSQIAVKASRIAHGADQLKLGLSVDEQAKLSLVLFGPSGVAVPLTSNGRRSTSPQLTVLRPGKVQLALGTAAGELKPGAVYRLRLSALDFDGNQTVRYADVTAPAKVTKKTREVTTTPAPAATVPAATTAPAATVPAATTTAPATTPAPATTAPFTPPPATTTPATTTPPATTTQPVTATHGRSRLSRWWHGIPNSPVARIWWAALVGFLVVVLILLGVYGLSRRGGGGGDGTDGTSGTSDAAGGE